MIRKSRIISQLFFTGLFFTLFILASYPLTSKIPVDLFLKLDPLLSISTAIAARNILIISIPAVIVLLLTIFAGRFFCSWICPMGAVIDLTDKITFSTLRKKRNSLTWLKFSILIIILTASVFSLQLAGFADPIALFTRSTVVLLYPLFVLLTEGIFGIFFNISFLEEHAFNLYDILKGTFLPLNKINILGNILICFVFISIILLGIFKKRFWCKNICPLGALLGIFSIKRIYARKVSNKCTDCGLCRNKCRMDAISEDFKSTNAIECINCYDCMDICPVNAVSFRFTRNFQKSSSVDFNRRKFIKSSAVGLLTVGLFNILYDDPLKKANLIRPPGSIPENQFLDRCVRCGECIRICSTSGGGLQPASIETGLESLWSPILVPETGYCEYNCDLCGKVCPTGAIHELNEGERQEIKIGTAHFNKSRCIPWYYGENCMVCEEHCPLPDKAIKFVTRKITSIEGKISQVMLPYIDESLCIGCGICVTKCPVNGERGIFVTNENEERYYT